MVSQQMEVRLVGGWSHNHGRRSGGGEGGGDASPHFSGWGDSIGIVPPTFQFRKIARHIA